MCRAFAGPKGGKSPTRVLPCPESFLWMAVTGIARHRALVCLALPWTIRASGDCEKGNCPNGSRKGSGRESPERKRVSNGCFLGRDPTAAFCRVIRWIYSRALGFVSREPHSIGATASGADNNSSRTRAIPAFSNLRARAAASDRSMVLPSMNGPRSLMTTSTLSSFSRF